MDFNLRRWGVFNLVGVAGFVVQVAAISILTRGAGWGTLPATLAGLELAALQNFLGHSCFTWPDRHPHSVRSWARRYLRYQAAKSASLAANLLLTLMFTDVGVPVELSNTCAVLICSVPNYLLSERWVYH